MAVRVVLADDEALLRRGLKVLLEADGRVEVVGEAADGAELVEAVLAHLPDVVLVDVQMPGVDGLGRCAGCAPGRRHPPSPC